MRPIEKKLAELNSMYATIREWQAGAITHRQMRYRLGDNLTAEQIAGLMPRLYRIIDAGSLASVLADVVGL